MPDDQTDFTARRPPERLGKAPKADTRGLIAMQHAEQSDHGTGLIAAQHTHASNSRCFAKIEQC